MLLAILAVVLLVLAIYGAAIILPIIASSATVIKIWDSITKAKEAADIIKGKVESIEQRIRAVISIDEIQQTIEYARAFDSIATITSQRYRNFKSELYTQTAEVSRAVFNDSTAILAAMQLLRLAVYDVTRLRNEPIDIAENSFFGDSLELMEMVNDKAREYRLRPGNFWSDLDIRFLTPLAREGDNATRANRAEMTILRNSIQFAEALVTSVNTRFTTYVTNLAPFLSVQKLQDLERIRLDYRHKVEIPIGIFSTFLADTWPEERDAQALLEAAAIDISIKQAILTEITENPDNLTTEDRKKQQTRFSLIMANVMDLSAASTPVVSQSRREVAEIFKVDLD